MSDFNSQAEIWQHLLDGGVVQDVISKKLCKFIEGKVHYKSVDSEDYEAVIISFFSHENYKKHVPEPKKSLTFDEAVKCDKVCVHTPRGAGNGSWRRLNHEN
jgi:hypothetical protein